MGNVLAINKSRKSNDEGAGGAQLLKYVMDGEETKAEALIKENPAILLQKGTGKDPAGRTFENITAFQYALWALDWYMWEMMLPHMDASEAREQYNSLMSRGTSHGKQFDLGPLITALQTYIDKYSVWSYEQCKQHWGNEVGGAQRQLPMHAVQEYCRSDRSFDPCPDFSKGARGREFKVDMHYGGSWHKDLAFKRSHWFPTPGVREEWDVDENLGWGRGRQDGGVGSVSRLWFRPCPGCLPPLSNSTQVVSAIDDLSNVRKQQHRALGESLSMAPVDIKWGSQEQIDKLITLVMDGEETEAEALIKENPAILLQQGTGKDPAGRTFENITAFQYALWALDWYMWEMMLPHMDTSEAREQYDALMSRGTSHGTQFDFSPLIAALQTYIDQYDGWSYAQRKQYWEEVVGGAQRQLPMHVVQEYCRTDRSFGPCPDFNKGQRGNEFKVVMYYDGSWHDEQVFKRSHWFPVDGSREAWAIWGMDNWVWERGGMLHARGGGRPGLARYIATGLECWDVEMLDVRAIDDLSNVRKDQFRALGESLSQAPHVSR